MLKDYNQTFLRSFDFFKRGIKRIAQAPKFANAYVLALQLKNIYKVPLPAVDVEISELKKIDRVEIASVAAFGFYGNKSDHILQFLDEGQKCWIAKHKDQVVSCNWVQDRSFFDHYLKRHLELADNEEYHLGVFTLAEYRGMGIVPYLHWQSLRDRFQDNNDLRLLVIIRTKNKSSLRSAQKAGYEVVGRIGFFELFGIRLHYLLGRNAFPKTLKRIYLQFFGFCGFLFLKEFSW